MATEIWSEIGSSSVLGGVRPILLKVVLFQLSGRGNPHDDATPNFISDSSSCISGLSNELSFVSEFLLKGGQNSQNVWLKTWGVVYFLLGLYFLPRKMYQKLHKNIYINQGRRNVSKVGGATSAPDDAATNSKKCWGGQSANSALFQEMLGGPWPPRPPQFRRPCLKSM